MISEKNKSRFSEGKYQNVKIKIEQNSQICHNFLNARVYTKHKIKLTWSTFTALTNY